MMNGCVLGAGGIGFTSNGQKASGTVPAAIAESSFLLAIGHWLSNRPTAADVRPAEFVCNQ